MKLNNIKKTFNNKYVKFGGYTTIISLVVVVIVVIVNLVFAQIPSIYTKFDTSSIKMYSISDETAELVKAIDTNIDMYYVIENGNEDATILELLNRYASLNSKIKLQKIDPMLHPNFVSLHTTETFTDSTGGILFISEKRTYLLDYYDIFTYETYADETTGELAYRSVFAGERKITSALNYVSIQEITTMYTLSGHGELTLSDTMRSYIIDDNIDITDLSLLTAGGVPDDASCVMIYSPQIDISTEEKDYLLEYMRQGGKVIIVTDYRNTDFPNLYEIGEYYGIQPYTGIVLEQSSNNYYVYPYFLIPKIGNHELIDMLPATNIQIFMPYAMGLKKTETLPRSTLTVTPLAYTTASAYLKTGEVSELAKADGDPEGQFDIIALATEPSTTGETTKLLWFASSSIIDESMDSVVSGNNSTFFLTSLIWMTDKPASVSIATKAMQVAALNLTEGEGNMWAVIFTIIIPLAVIATGLVIWIKRRRR